MGYLRLLRTPRVAALWLAQTLSVLGDRLFALAVMWIAWERSGAVAMGLVAVAESLPYVLLGMFGRSLISRAASFRTLAALDGVRAVLVAALPWTWDLAGTGGMLTIVTLLGVAGALFDPGLATRVPDLVAPDQVQAVMGLMDLTRRIARIAGPASAGALLAVLPEPGLFALDGVTFLVSAVALVMLAASSPVRARFAATDRERGPAARPASARELLRTHPRTTCAIAMHGAGLCAQQVTIGLPILLATQFHAGMGAYGLVLAATGVGALAGNMVAGNLRRVSDGFPGVYCAAWLAAGVVLAATGLATSLPALVALSVAGGLVSPFASVGLATHLAQYPDQIRLRLITVDHTVIRASGLAAMAVIPALIEDAPAGGFVAGGLFTVVAAALAWTASTLVTVRAPVRAPEPVPQPAGD